MITSWHDDKALVVGVMGPWGSGKTSFAELLKHRLPTCAPNSLQTHTLFAINPWLLTTTEDWLVAFFQKLRDVCSETPTQVTRNLKKRLPRLEKATLAFGAGVGPLASFTLTSRSTKLANLEKERAEIHDLMKQLNQRIVVVVDDLDRVPASEVRGFFRVLTLLINLPNVVFVLLFDREQMAKALAPEAGENTDDGRRYLEKIIHIPVDLSHPSPWVLNRFAKNLLGEEVTAKIDVSLGAPLNVILTILETPRQITRWAAAVKLGSDTWYAEVNPVVASLLDAIRISEPILYDAIRASRGVIINKTPFPLRLDDQEEWKALRQKGINHLQTVAKKKNNRFTNS